MAWKGVSQKKAIKCYLGKKCISWHKWWNTIAKCIAFSPGYVFSVWNFSTNLGLSWKARANLTEMWEDFYWNVGRFWVWENTYEKGRILLLKLDLRNSALNQIPKREKQVDSKPMKISGSLSFFASLAFRSDFKVEILSSLISVVLGWDPLKTVCYLWRISSKNGELPFICHIPAALAKLNLNSRQLYTRSSVFIDEGTLGSPGECL